ncbi:hypothetical protein MPH_04945 [Macrophomina phaseolina MS6]|uniref:Uncharacterized protein n=1 Tax=Macrophomina phaseolina (strain MS6) TaxID=1126212 RepID=K2RSU2_MACPH|nr:hypothetical protein MPH_04945 [Macrophomina phaseolina MS6]
MCTSPTTIYNCGHIKPDHIIEFCYTDFEDDCGHVHPRFERLARKCPGCTRRAHRELERKSGIPAHGPHDEDAAAVRSASPSLSQRSLSSSSSDSSSPKGEYACAPLASDWDGIAEVGRQLRVSVIDTK